jgi:adenosylcobinamide-GDP ribazoletransferase
MQSLVAAFKYLTIWGRLLPKPPLDESHGAIALYFPLVGLFLGLLLALLNYALGRSLDSELLSILLISFLVIATGAAHCDGAKKTFDALLSKRLGPKNAQESIFGSIVLFVLILLKIRAVEVTDDKIAVSLLLAPALARWSLVIFIFGYHDRCEATARRIAENLRIWHLVVTTAAILGLAFYFLGRKGLWIGLGLSVLALLARSLLHRRHAVLTQENFGAMIEIGEALSFILLASL